MLHRMYILELLKSSFQLLLVILRVYFVVMHLHNTKLKSLILLFRIQKKCKEHGIMFHD